MTGSFEIRRWEQGLHNCSVLPAEGLRTLGTSGRPGQCDLCVASPGHGSAFLGCELEALSWQAALKLWPAFIECDSCRTPNSWIRQFRFFANAGTEYVEIIEAGGWPPAFGKNSCLSTASVGFQHISSVSKAGVKRWGHASPLELCSNTFPPLRLNCFSASLDRERCRSEAAEVSEHGVKPALLFECVLGPLRCERLRGHFRE